MFKLWCEYGVTDRILPCQLCHRSKDNEQTVSLQQFQVPPQSIVKKNINNKKSFLNNELFTISWTVCMYVCMYVNLKSVKTKTNYNCFT